MWTVCRYFALGVGGVGGECNSFFRLAFNCAPESIKFLFGFYVSSLDFLCIHFWSHCMKIHVKFSMELSPTFLPCFRELYVISIWSYISCYHNPVTCRWIHCSNSKSDCVLVCAIFKNVSGHVAEVSFIFLAVTRLDVAWIWYVIMPTM